MTELRLILMRHGEAEDGRGLPDHARRLTARGEADARRVASRLVKAGLVPTVAISSDSQRTRETAAAAGPEFPASLSWTYLPDLYLCGLDRVQAAMARIDAGSHQTLLLLGHNPGFSSSATILSGEDVSLGTSCAAVLTVDAADWREASQLTGAWTLDRTLTP